MSEDASQSERRLQIQVLAGPTEGRRVRTSAEAVRFGRGPGNDLVLDLPHVSREHGELRRGEDGRWRLINHSPNGTRLNRRKVTTKPRALPADATLRIGDEDVLRVTTVDSEAEPEAAATGGSGSGGGAEADRAGASHESGVSRGSSSGGLLQKRSVWIGLGLYLLVMVGLVVFFAMNSDDGEGPVTTAPQRTEPQIRAELMTPLPNQPPDPRRVASAIDDAREAWATRGVAPDAVYRAFEAYREAASVSPEGHLQDPLEAQRFRDVREQLIEEVVRRYQRAYNLLMSEQYERASTAFRELVNYFPARRSETYENAQEHWSAARDRMED